MAELKPCPFCGEKIYFYLMGDYYCVFGMPPAEVYKKEEWLDKLKAALEKRHGITEELRAYDGGSEAIKDE